MNSGKIKPTIGTPKINGSSINSEIASFLEPNGVDLVNSIKDEINSFNYNKSFSGYYVFGYHDAESVEIRNFPPNPPIAVFNTGGVDVIVPLSDFLQILGEWKAFVASVPTPHWLENR
jgi:hypothetical protein